MPKDLQKFITLARASYTAAQSAPYAAQLAKYGFPTASATAAMAEVAALSSSNEAQSQAIGSASGATQARDEAGAALDAWIRQFKRIAKVALRGKPDLAKSLKVN